VLEVLCTDRKTEALRGLSTKAELLLRVILENTI